MEGAIADEGGLAPGNVDLGRAGAWLAGAATNSLITGMNFGQSLVQEAPNTIAASVGDALGNAINLAGEKDSAGQKAYGAEKAWGDLGVSSTSDGGTLVRAGTDPLGDIVDQYTLPSAARGPDLADEGKPATPDEFSKTAPDAWILQQPLYSQNVKISETNSNWNAADGHARTEAGFQIWAVPIYSDDDIQQSLQNDPTGAEAAGMEAENAFNLVTVWGVPPQGPDGFANHTDFPGEVDLPEGSELLVEFHTRPWDRDVPILGSNPPMVYSFRQVPSQADVNTINQEAGMTYLRASNAVAVVATQKQFYYYGPGVPGLAWDH